MNRKTIFALLVVAPALVLAARAQEPTAAQPTLPTEGITIVTKDGQRHPFKVEVAATQAQQTVGEMFRPGVPADGGMLFVWPAPRESQMWMKNTLVPLDMVFIDPDGRISAIAEDTVPQSLRIIDSGGPVAATLELAGGTTARLGIVVGDKVTGPRFHGAG